MQQIDEQIAVLVNEILHHEKFQALESVWRSLQRLCLESASSKKIRIRLLDASWHDVAKDMAGAVEFDQTVLFNLVYTQEFGSPGGIPFSVLVGAYEIRHQGSYGRDDVETLRGIAEISAAAFSPFLCNASPALFGLDEFSELYLVRDLSAVFELREYQRWNRQLRAFTDSRFLGICLPRILLRSPYSKIECAEKGLNFEERISGDPTRSFCWGHASFAFALTLIREFEQVGWFSRIRGAPRDSIAGGVVDQFPSPVLAAAADAPFVMNTDAKITEKQEKNLADLGFIALHKAYGAQQSIFLSNPSVHRPPQTGDRMTRANADAGSMLQQILCASRFAHYIKLIIRDKVGAFFTARDCQSMLEQWLRQYTSGRHDLDWESRARYPLKAYRVEVHERPEYPGSFSCVIDLQPHYHAEHILSELKLTTELVQMAATS